MANRRIGQSFLGATALWWAVLVGLGFVFKATAASSPGSTGGVWEALWSLPRFMGLFLPFAGFAGGVALQTVRRARAIVVPALLLAAVSYGLYGFLEPMVRYNDLGRAGVDLTERYPFGPETPTGLVTLRSEVRTHPPAEYGHSVDKPLSIPPNWWTYLIHDSVALAGFGFLAVLLGMLAGRLTSGLSPPRKRNTRWAIGLVIGASYLGAANPFGDWVRTDLSNSGILAAYLPLAVPLAELALLWILTRARKTGLHARNASGVP